jgi:hypothetical protein
MTIREGYARVMVDRVKTSTLRFLEAMEKRN